jgi:hypothetical protein
MYNIPDDDTMDSAIKIKLLKRDLKIYEHSFLTENGRKPEKKDIAANTDIGLSH